MTVEKGKTPEVYFDTVPGVTLPHPGKVSFEALRA
jgi:hypothetical protein